MINKLRNIFSGMFKSKEVNATMTSQDPEIDLPDSPEGELHTKPLQELHNNSETDGEEEIAEPLIQDVEVIIEAPREPMPTPSDGVTRPLSQDLFDIPVELIGRHPQYGILTDVGRVRPNNQDSAFAFLASTRSIAEMPDFGIFIVADGMGGHENGEKASNLAVQIVASSLTKKLFAPLLVDDERVNDTPLSEYLDHAIQQAHHEISVKAPGGGTTISAVVLLGGLAQIAHVGDSRIYLIHNRSIEKLTRDHSVAQRLLEVDEITPEQAANHPQKSMLYKALGQNDSIEADSLTKRLPRRSHLVLCSDGLWGSISEQEIVDIVSEYSDAQEACRRLIAAANANGGQDNITAIVLQLA